MFAISSAVGHTPRSIHRPAAGRMRRCGLMLLTLLLTTPCVLGAQEGAITARNGIYLELLGNGGLYSLNYDRLLSRRLSLRAGITHWTDPDEYRGSVFSSSRRTTLTALPLMANYLVGRGNSRFEAGAGVLVGRQQDEHSRSGEATTRTSTSFVTLTATAGYRYQRRTGGVIFRIGFTPFYGLNNEDDAYPDRGFFPSLGTSIGYGF